MKFLFNFLKKLLPTLSMFAGGIIPITLTAQALTSSIPITTDSSQSLVLENTNKPSINEKTLSPKPEPKKPEAPAAGQDNSKSTKQEEKGSQDQNTKGNEQSDRGDSGKESTEESDTPNLDKGTSKPSTGPEQPLPKPKKRKTPKQLKGLLSKYKTEKSQEGKSEINELVNDLLANLAETLKKP